RSSPSCHRSRRLCAACVCLCSFYSCRPPRHLPSFPTRRSSDLVGHGDVRLALLANRFEYRRLGLLDETHLRFYTLAGVHALFEGDRKSTRLNSSHVKISYAVFCLKKKKKHNKLHQHSGRDQQWR